MKVICSLIYYSNPLAVYHKPSCTLWLPENSKNVKDSATSIIIMLLAAPNIVRFPATQHHNAS
jgi:hypothetical protein